MIRLIVNADDLGSGQLRDRGILTAFTDGIVSSASLLANGPSFASAATEAIACNLPLGVHLNLSEGRALTGPIAGLTDAAGNFPGKTALRALLRTGHLDSDGLRRELLAQIARVREAGITPDHLDTHQHCHLFPALTQIVADVAELSGIRAMRLPLPSNHDSSGANAATPGDGDDYLHEELGLYRQLAPTVRRTLHARNLWTPDGLWGMPLLNRLDTDSLAETLARIPVGTWELMVHPGYPDPGDPFGGPQRAAELAALTDPAIRRLVAARGIALTNFGVCACIC